MNAAADYGDEHIRTLDWKEHIRRRPGMYIGKLGDGTSADDGIYILIKEVLDNSIDEYMMGFGKTIDVTVGDDGRVSVRDYGRGIPLGKLVDVASKMNTGAKYDSKAFKKSVGLNGVGIKAVNALSEWLEAEVYQNGHIYKQVYNRGVPQRSVGTRMRVARLEPTAAAMFPVISPIMESLSTSAMGAIRISAFRAAQHTAFSPVAPR